MSTLRPSGELQWALGLSAAKCWSFLGCLGPEPRSVSALLSAHELGVLDTTRSLLLRVQDETPQNPARENELIKINQTHLSNARLTPETPEFGILDAWPGWLSAFDGLRSDCVMLDISSMPKRFFFRYLKELLLDCRIRNLLLCYTLPGRYDSGPLSGDPEEWEALPGFLPDDPDVQTAAGKRIVVNVGFMPDGLLEHLGEDDREAVAHLFIPFPAPTRTVKRTWAAVRQLVLGYDPDKPIDHRIYRVPPQDMSEAFDRLVALSGNQTFPISLAPFGPKPISAAMCLYASQTGMPVYYAQPKTYSPDYSSGVGSVMGYWVKHEGRNLYGLPEPNT